MFFAEYSLLAISSKQVHYPEYVHMCLCWFGSHCFNQDSVRLPEIRKMNNMRGQRFRFTACVSCAKGIFKVGLELASNPGAEISAWYLLHAHA